MSMHNPRFVLPQLGIAVLTVAVMRWCPRYSLETPPIVEDTFAEAPLRQEWDSNPPSGSFVSVSEGIHITADTTGRPYVCQRCPVPKGATRFLVSGIAKCESLRLGDAPWKGGRCLLYFPDESGTVDWSIPHTAVKLTGTTEWTAFSRIFPVPPHAKHFETRIENAGLSGIFTVRDLTVQALRVPTVFGALRWLLGVCWIGLVAFFLVRSLRCHGTRVLFVAIPVLFILVGVVLPNNHLFSIVHTACRPIENVLGHPQQTDGAQSPGLGPVIQSRIRSRHLFGLAKRSGHVGLFALLALGACACVFSAKTDRRELYPGLSRLAIPLIVFAACTEVLQMLTLDRSPKLRDWSLDTAGVVIGLAIGWFIIRHCQPTTQERNVEEKTLCCEPPVEISSHASTADSEPHVRG